MFAKRSFALLAAICCCLCLWGQVLASDGGSESPAIAPAVDCDSIYCFNGGEFGENLTGVCILRLPESEAGTVLLGSRVIRQGDILAADQLSLLTFQPLRTEKDVDATVTYLPIYENRVEKEATMTISIRGKVDQVPVAEDSVLETYKNLANQGKLKVSDPEGSVLTYTLTRGPKRGEVNIAADGSFTYTPKKNKVGTDSFTYTATDGAGNASREATVTIQILKPSDKTFYADTQGEDCRFAAEWMKNTGLFVGETVGDQCCFRPEAEVSRGEFVTMLVQSLGLQVEESVVHTGFEEDCPNWLKPYLAAAQRAGLTAGWPNGSTFGAKEPITGAEAALMIQNALDLPTSVMAQEHNAAQCAVAVMAENGVALTADAPLTRSDVAMALYRVSKLAATAPGMMVLAKR